MDENPAELLKKLHAFSVTHRFATVDQRLQDELKEAVSPNAELIYNFKTKQVTLQVGSLKVEMTPVGKMETDRGAQ